MIVEDDHEMAQTLAQMLNSAGYETMISQDVMAGIKQAHDFNPDLVVLDLMLPGGGGLSFLKHIERSLHTSQIPVMVLTGMQDEEYKKKILAAGVKAYLEKPYKVEGFLSEVAKILNVE